MDLCFFPFFQNQILLIELKSYVISTSIIMQDGMDRWMRKG